MSILKALATAAWQFILTTVSTMSAVFGLLILIIGLYVYTEDPDPLETTLFFAQPWLGFSAIFRSEASRVLFIDIAALADMAALVGFAITVCLWCLRRARYAFFRDTLFELRPGDIVALSSGGIILLSGELTLPYTDEFLPEGLCLAGALIILVTVIHIPFRSMFGLWRWMDL